MTSVELLPVHTFVNDSHLLEKGLTNYWGYNTIGFFAPDPRYAADVANSLREFKEMVARFTRPGSKSSWTWSTTTPPRATSAARRCHSRASTMPVYYRLLPDKQRYYINDTGTGNTLNLSHPRVIQMVTDSLRYWARKMHVDGFRFDLGTILAREARRLRRAERLSQSLLTRTRCLRTVKLIAEPWDCGPGGYQVGGFPPGWAEWNDKFRDTVRDFWRGEAPPSALAPRLRGSGDCLQPPRPPSLGVRQFHHGA